MYLFAETHVKLVETITGFPVYTSFSLTDKITTVPLGNASKKHASTFSKPPAAMEGISGLTTIVCKERLISNLILFLLCQLCHLMPLKTLLCHYVGDLCHNQHKRGYGHPLLFDKIPSHRTKVGCLLRLPRKSHI